MWCRCRRTAPVQCHLKHRNSTQLRYIQSKPVGAAGSVICRRTATREAALNKTFPSVLTPFFFHSSCSSCDSFVRSSNFALTARSLDNSHAHKLQEHLLERGEWFEWVCRRCCNRGRFPENWKPFAKTSLSTPLLLTLLHSPLHPWLPSSRFVSQRNQ